MVWWWWWWCNIIDANVADDDDDDDDDGGDVEPRRAPGRPHRGRLYRRRQECTDGTCRWRKSCKMRLYLIFLLLTNSSYNISYFQLPRYLTFEESVKKELPCMLASKGARVESDVQVVPAERMSSCSSGFFWSVWQWSWWSMFYLNMGTEPWMRAVEPHFVLWEVTDLKMTFQSIHTIE